MSTKIVRKGLSTLLNSRIIEILSDVPGANKAIELLKENFTFTAAEIAKNLQDSYGYALAAISSGLAAPENQRGFWQSLFKSNVKSEFSQRLEREYLLPFAQQQGLANEKLSAFRQTAVAQYQQIATFTLFQADNVLFSEAELANFVTASGTSSMTDLVVELVQTQQSLDEQVIAFLQFKELVGNALLFFLHEQLRKEPRFQTTLAALQREGLIIDVREIKHIVQSTENKLTQAVTEKRFGEVAQLGQQLERLQQVESVTQTHYAQFLEFSQRFADWAQLVNVQLEEVLDALPKLQEQLGGIKSDTEEILALIRQLMARADLSPQIKPRDELTQYNPASLELIKKARQLLKRIPPSNPQYSRVAIGLGSIVSSQGNLKQAEALFIKAYQQASNDKERALSAFNLFQVFVRQHVYDKALSSLQEAITLNQQRYALHNIHTYTLQKILGAGGMGCVFLAQHRLKKESVVIKCFWETLHDSPDALFKEAFLMAEIAGEYVPQPLDCGFVDIARQERGYFISEYIKGAIDGETWLAKHGKLDVQTGIAVGLQIAKGLQLAHDKGIFHLDLKPANILLQRRKPSEVSVKIIDFGLAKVAPSLGQEMATQRSRSGLSLLAQAAVFGTLDYAPPEQQGVTCYGEPNAKSDVYAFGKTLYRFITGESPHTFHPRRLADAPELFELLCDCVEIEPRKRVNVVSLTERLMGLLTPISQPLLLEEEGEFVTKDIRVKGRLKIFVKAEVNNLESLRDYLSPHKSVLNEIKRVIFEQAQLLIHNMEPERFYMRFSVPDPNQEKVSVEKLLREEITQKLANTLSLTNISVTIKAHQENDVLAKRIHALQEGFHDFQFETSPIREGGNEESVTFRGEFKVLAVCDFHTFQINNYKSLDKEVADIREVLQKDIIIALEIVPNHLLRYRDQKTKTEVLKTFNYSLKRIAKQFGLMVEIVNLKRLLTQSEQLNIKRSLDRAEQLGDSGKIIYL